MWSEWWWVRRERKNYGKIIDVDWDMMKIWCCVHTQWWNGKMSKSSGMKCQEMTRNDLYVTRFISKTCVKKLKPK